MEIDELPFGGLIPSTIKGEILAQIVADPFTEYTPKRMAFLVGRAPSRVSEALKELEGIGIIEDVSKGSHRPLFVTTDNSRRLTALTFLALAVGDDRTGDECMNIAIIDYVRNSLGLEVVQKAPPAAEILTNSPQEGMVQSRTRADGGTEEDQGRTDRVEGRGAMTDGIKIFMPQAAAQRLAEMIVRSLEDGESEGRVASAGPDGRR
ncbi:MAG: hypothetical protein WCK39_00320 [Methanomassiliicoccales archaeon]